MYDLLNVVTLIPTQDIFTYKIHESCDIIMFGTLEMI